MKKVENPCFRPYLLEAPGNIPKFELWGNAIKKLGTNYFGHENECERERLNFLSEVHTYPWNLSNVLKACQVWNNNVFLILFLFYLF